MVDALHRALAHLAENDRQRGYDEMNDDAVMGAYMRVGPEAPRVTDRRRRLHVIAWHRADPLDAYYRSPE